MAEAKPEFELPDEITYELPDDVHVLVGTPNYTNLFSSEAHSNHIECVSAWDKWGLKYNWMIIGRTFVQFARSQTCQAALDGKFSHIFWVDDDAMIDPHVLPKLLQYDKDVVIVPYPMRRSPFEVGILSATQFICRPCNNHRFTCDSDITPPVSLPCPKCGKDAPRNFHEHASYRNLTTKDLDQGLIDVDGGGTHVMLMKTDILRSARGFKQPQPGEPFDPNNDSYAPEAMEVYLRMQGQFDTPSEKHLIDHYIGEIPNQNMTFEEEADTGAKPFFIMPKVGTEDMLYCFRAKCKGVKIYAATDLWANHIGFPPVITRGFTEQAEKLNTANMKTGDVVLSRPGVGRDHTSIKRNAASSLT